MSRKTFTTELKKWAISTLSDVKEQAATSGSKMGKVLVIRFHWYKPLKRSVTLEEIRKMDENFNPQRGRTLSAGLYQSILSAGDLGK